MQDSRVQQLPHHHKYRMLPASRPYYLNAAVHPEGGSPAQGNQRWSGKAALHAIARRCPTSLSLACDCPSSIWRWLATLSLLRASLNSVPMRCATSLQHSLTCNQGP